MKKMKFSTKSNILHYEIRFEGAKIIRLIFNGIFDQIDLSRDINNSRFRSNFIIIFSINKYGI